MNQRSFTQTTPAMRQRQFIAIVVGMLILVWLSDLVGVGAKLQSRVEVLVQPLMVQVSNQVALVRQPFFWFFDYQQKLQRLQQLEFLTAQLSSDIGELQALREENEMLKQAMADQQQPQFAQKMVVAPITSLAYPAIAAGADQGVSVGQAVTVAKTVLGVVKSVTANQAEVSLLAQVDHPPLLVKTESGAQGLVVGDGRRVMLTEIPTDHELQVGERVVTLGQTGIQPDLFVGQIQSVKRDVSAPVQTAYLEQFVSFYQERVVFVE